MRLVDPDPHRLDPLNQGLAQCRAAEPDLEQAVYWFRVAADATFNLAGCLDTGCGCQPDRLAAKALFLRARRLGSRLKVPGLRIRQGELDAVRELARRLQSGSELPCLIEARQQKIALMQDLVQRLPRKPGLTRQQRRQLLRLASLTAIAAGLTAALAGLPGWRLGPPLAHDAGPTSID